MDKKLMILIIVGITIVISLYNKSGIAPFTNIPPGDSSVNIPLDPSFDQYLVVTQDFDFDNKAVMQQANLIKSESSSTEDAIKRTLKFVVQNVHYSSAISVDYCYEEKASTVLSSGKGDCVSMSRLVTALLRAQGIPTRTMGGCLSLSQYCAPLMSIIPDAKPQVTPLTIGDFKKRGFLHEWTEIYDGTKWVLGEATSGQIFPISGCNSYLPYGYDSNSYDRCIINDNSFWKTCSTA